MIEAPFGFFEVVIEVLPANAAKFCQTQFGVAPEGLNAVDMTTVSGKFIVVMVDAMVLIAFQSPIRRRRASHRCRSCSCGEAPGRGSPRSIQPSSSS